MKSFRLSIDFTKAALDAIANDQPFEGRLTVEILPNPGRESRRRRSDAKRLEKTSVAILTPDEKALVDFWNNGEPVREKMDAHTQRNLPMKIPLSLRDHSAIRVALRTHDKNKLLRYLQTYFDLCCDGKQYYRKRNVAYKDLPNFLARLSRCIKDQEPAWWMDSAEAKNYLKLEDQDVTAAIADLFAVRFMKSEFYPERIEDKDYQAFRAGQKEAEAIAERYNLSFDEGTKVLFDAAVETFGPKPIFPAHLMNHKFLKMALPQFLEREYG